MEIIGFICLMLVGLFLIVASFQVTIACYALSGKWGGESFFFALLFLIGCVIVWYAISEAPFTITFS